MHNKLGIALLFALVFALLIGACSDNPAIQARYQAEKLFFQAEKAARNARIRPELVSPQGTRELMEQYRVALDFSTEALGSFSAASYPREHAELSNLAFQSATRLSQLAFGLEMYDTCISVLTRQSVRPELTGVARVSVFLNLGRALQADGQWDSALAVYDYCVETFYPPVDEQGRLIPNLFGLPAHILDVYTRLGDTLSATDQVNRALTYYMRLRDNAPNPDIKLAAHAGLANLYERTGRPERAVEELSRLVDSTGAIVNSARLRIASLHAGKLDMPETALREYDEVLASLQGRDTLARPGIMFNQALVHLHLERYAEVRRIVGILKADHRRFFDNTPDAQFAVARSFELENNWSRAETEYQFLIENYTGTEQSMGAYLYLIHKYRELGRNLEANRLEERAESDFSRIAATRPGTMAEAQALSHKAELYQRRGEWTRAVQLLTETFDKFPTTEVGYGSMIQASVIMREKLNDGSAADSLLQVLRRRLTEIDDSGKIPDLRP